MDESEPSTLTYGKAPELSLRLTKLIAVVSLLSAILGFPAGAGLSIFTAAYSNVFSHSLSERSGFMLFATMEGAAIASGVFAALRARGASRTVFRVAIVGAVLGAIGSAAVLILIFSKSIR